MKSLAFGAAAAFVRAGAVLTLYKQQVAAFIGAIGVRIGRHAALVAVGNHIFGDALSQPVVETQSSYQ